MPGAFHVSDPLFIGIALALFIGATGKSAQIPLYVWLPDAMEGPTPVSALIHAATMVTAGVYMVARSNFIYPDGAAAMTVVAVDRRVDRVVRRVDRSGAERHQARAGVFDRQPTRLHVPGARRRRIRRRHLPPDDARVLQGAALPWFRQRDSCDASRAGHAEDGRAARTRFRSPSGRWPSERWRSRERRVWRVSSRRTKSCGRRFRVQQGHIVLWLIGATVAGMTAFYMFRLLFMTFFGESQSRSPHGAITFTNRRSR